MVMLIFLFGGLGVILIFGLFTRNMYGFSVKEILILEPIYLAIGLIGSRLFFAIENEGSIVGQLFYGVVFILPIFLYPISKLIKIPYYKIMGQVAANAALFIAWIKIACFIEGCCDGKFLFYLSDFTPVYFPSHGFEFLTAIVLLIVNINMAKKEKYKYTLYPIYMIAYGITRFIANCFREDVKPFIFNIPGGHFWPLVIVFLGIISLIIINKKTKKSVD